ncbi:MAG TPA: hypothetical protein VFA10_19815 [Ktedonobacteraceae bacterium]|nr:hypothetical protein [Ktedonobacteraceae bacterium]
MIKPEGPESTDQRLPPPGQFSSFDKLEQAGKSDQTIELPMAVSETLSIPSGSSSLRTRTSKGRYLLIGSSVLICLLLLGSTGIFWWIQQSQRTTSKPSRPITMKKTTPTPTHILNVFPVATPTKKATPVPSLSHISFEDGSVDGWQSSSQDGTIQSIENVATSQAKDGTHVLMVSFDSDDDNSYPCVGTNILPAPLKAGQTITASLLKLKGSRVKADLYIVDQTGRWYSANALTLVDSSDTWYLVTFTVPSTLKGPAAQLGLILFGDNAVVYIDAIHWS